jgi:hypothetical protein
MSWEVIGNKIIGSQGDGISVEDLQKADILFNLIRDSGGDGIVATESNGRIVHNTIINPKGAGVNIKGSNVKMYNNIIMKTNGEGPLVSLSTSPKEKIEIKRAFKILCQ